jgi:hypothetical protein
MKAAAILLVLLIALSPAVFARASSFYMNPANQLIVKRSSNITGIQRAAYVARNSTQNLTHYVPLQGISGVSVTRTPSLEQPGIIGTFGKPWLRKQASQLNYPTNFVPVGGIANETPGISKAPCADFGCKASQYVVADTSTKEYFRCWCDAAKKIKPENLKCLDSPGVARRMEYREGKC